MWLAVSETSGRKFYFNAQKCELSKEQILLQKFGFIKGIDNVNIIGHRTEILKADVSSVSPSSEQVTKGEGLMLKTPAFRISVRWPIYIINSFDKTKFLYTTSPPTQHHSFFRNYPLQRFC